MVWPKVIGWDGLQWGASPLLVTSFRGLSKAILGALLGEGGEAGITSCILQREKPKSTRSENIPLQSHLYQLPKWEPATFSLEGAESNSPSNYLKYKWEEQVLEKQNRKRGNKERGEEGEREVKRAGIDRADMGQGGGEKKDRPRKCLESPWLRLRPLSSPAVISPSEKWDVGPLHFPKCGSHITGDTKTCTSHFNLIMSRYGYPLW